MASLVLIPVTLGDTPHECVLPACNREKVSTIRYFVVEEIRTARRFLRRMDSQFPIDDCTFMPMGKHSDSALFDSYLKPLREGHDVGVISEAGCPAVADPGADLVAIAQRQGHSVVPLVGPNSMILAVMASGLCGQAFAFNGYLPIDEGERDKRIKALEARAWSEGQTQLMIETPYRNAKFFSALLRVLRPQTRLCVAAGITTPDEWIKTRSVEQWRNASDVRELNKIPTVFLIGK